MTFKYVIILIPTAVAVLLHISVFAGFFACVHRQWVRERNISDWEHTFLKAQSQTTKPCTQTIMLALRFLASIDQSLFVLIFSTPTSKPHSLSAIFVKMTVPKPETQCMFLWQNSVLFI